MTIILRKQIVSTMLEVIREYEFSNVANQLAIQVLDQLKSFFDEQDLDQLKQFVRIHLSNNDQVHLKFQQGRQTNKTHLAAIIKMALVLKKMTLEGGLLQSAGKSGEENERQAEEEI